MDTLYPVNAVADAPAYSGRMLRQSNSVFLAGATAARPLGARSGVRPGTSTTTVTATSTTWTCGPFAGVIDGEAAAEAGPYTFSFDAAATGAMVAANASNPRVDIIYVQVDDPSEADGTSAPVVRRGYLAGVAAASPVAPAAPARSFAVAQINVPKSGGGAPTASLVAPYAVSGGGVLPVDTLANLNLITGSGGQYADVYADTAAKNGLYRWAGSWVMLSGASRTSRLTTTTAQNTGASNNWSVMSWTHDDSADGLWTPQVPNGIIVDRDGWYQFNSNVRAGATSYISLAINAVADPTRQGAADALGEMKISGLVKLTAGQSLGVWMSSTGAAQPVLPGNCSFDATWLHA